VDHLGVRGIRDDQVVLLAESVHDQVIEDAAVGLADHGVLGFLDRDRAYVPDE
jgi:hypothetical protein